MKKQKLVFLTAFAMSLNASAMGLDEYLQAVQKKNKTFQSLQASEEAADGRFAKADLELSPIFNMSGSLLDDKSIGAQGTTVTSHTQVRQYGLGFAKKFSTGTQASVDGSVQALNVLGSAGGSPFAAEMHTGTLGVSLSQSLWKDFMGKSTKLRWEREQSQRLQEKASYDLQAKQALISAEAAFWDLLYLQQELELRKESLDRANKIEAWVKRRYENGIGDKADVLNSEGLRAGRELQLLTTQDDLKAAEKAFNDHRKRWVAAQTVDRKWCAWIHIFLTCKRKQLP